MRKSHRSSNRDATLLIPTVSRYIESGLPTELTLCAGSSSPRTTAQYPAGKAGLDYPITGRHVLDNAALLEAIVASESANGAWLDLFCFGQRQNLRDA